MQGLQNIHAQRIHIQRDLLARIRRIDRPLPNQAAGFIAQQQYAIRYGQRFVNIMRDQYRGGVVAFNDLAQQFLHLATGDLVQCGKRLVQQNDLRLTCQRACQCHALRHPAGQGRRVGIGRVAQADFLHGRLHALLSLAFADLRLVFERQAKRDVLAHGQPRQ